MRLKWVRQDAWQILAVCSERGDCHLLDFFSELEAGAEKDGRRMLRLLDRIASQGPPRNTEISHQLDRDIWELIQGRIRVLWFYDEGKVVICSHGFIKKSRKAPQRAIQRARRDRQAYFRSKEQQSLQIER